MRVQHCFDLYIVFIFCTSILNCFNLYVVFISLYIYPEHIFSSQFYWWLLQSCFASVHVFIMICLNILFSVNFLKQAFTNIVFHVVMLVLNWYHCSELTVYRKLDSSGCKIVFYTNFILMFQCFNVNIDLPHHHCWLHESLYCTSLGSWSTEMHLNHLPPSLFPWQLLYSHKSALINMHHDEGSGEQIILQLNQQCNHITELWIRSNMFRLNQYILLQSHIWVKNLPIYSGFMILNLNHSSAVIMTHYISKMRPFDQMNAIFLAV